MFCSFLCPLRGRESKDIPKLSVGGEWLGGSWRICKNHHLTCLNPVVAFIPVLSTNPFSFKGSKSAFRSGSEQQQKTSGFCLMLIRRSWRVSPVLLSPSVSGRLLHERVTGWLWESLGKVIFKASISSKEESYGSKIGKENNWKINWKKISIRQQPKMFSEFFSMYSYICLSIPAFDVMQ